MPTLLPATTKTETNSQQLVALLFPTRTEKAGRGGHGGHGVGRPGSRGGHPWTDSRGNVRYGPQPQQMLRTHGPSANLRAAAARQKPGQRKPVASSSTHAPALHPNSLAATRLRQTRMLEELTKVYRTGKDPHGNKLDATQLAQVGKLMTALRIQTHPINNQGVGRTKEIAAEVTREITTKAQARLPFTVFKDAKGQYRWVGVSSSAAEDGDGETVSQKALQDDVARKDITGSYGPLNWWHTPIRLGTCDFNAMDGPLLVESGTFVNNRVAVAVAKAISDGKLEPGMSLEFEHNEPGPPVLPGRVFKRINKIGRALLPAEKASNLLTSFKVYNSLKSTAPAGDNVAAKESTKMLTEEKYKKLESIIPADLLEGLLSGNEVAVKSAELAGYSFKAMTPPPAMAKDVTNAVQAPAVPDKTKQQPLPATAKADGVLDPALAAVTGEAETPMEDLAEGGTEEGEGGYEDSPADAAADALMQGLYSKIDEIVQTRLEAASKDILAALGGVNAKATASKEVSDALTGITVALKENAAAFEKVLGENTALKARLDALEGIQPPAVRARASQQGGLSAEQLSASDKELVATEKENQDPYLKIIQQLGLVPGPRG